MEEKKNHEYNRFEHIYYEAQKSYINMLHSRIKHLGDKFSTICVHCLQTLTKDSGTILIKDYIGFQAYFHSDCALKKVVDMKPIPGQEIVILEQEPLDKENRTTMNFIEALEGARVLYHNAVNDYNAYVESYGVMLVQNLTEKQAEALEILLDRTIVMQNYFKNILEARNIFDSLED